MYDFIKKMNLIDFFIFFKKKAKKYSQLSKLAVFLNFSNTLPVYHKPHPRKNHPDLL